MDKYKKYSINEKVDYAESQIDERLDRAAYDRNYDFRKDSKYHYFRGYDDGIYDNIKWEKTIKNKSYRAGVLKAKKDIMLAFTKKL